MKIKGQNPGISRKFALRVQENTLTLNPILN